MSALEKLSYVEIKNNELSDITSLVNLKDIYHLNLSINNISDLSPISGLTNIETLYIGDNPFSYITVLQI